MDESNKMDNSLMEKEGKKVHKSSNISQSKMIPDSLEARLKKYNRLLFILAAAVVLAVLIFFIMFFILFMNFYSMNSQSYKKNELQNSTELEIQRRSISSTAHRRRCFLSNDPVTSIVSSSCADIKKKNPNSASGYYFVRSQSVQLKSVYCDMTKHCGGLTGGWMRVAKLDVQNCPKKMQPKNFTNNGIIMACITKNPSGSCTSLFYSSQNISYSKVCGKITGYQVGTLDSFHEVSGGINGNYLDGVSVTVNRAHVWSLAAGWRCRYRPPSFVGSSYNCERGTICPNGRPCNCPFQSLCRPLLWNRFWYKRIPRNTVADLEVRICRNHPRGDEDIAITAIDLYIQ